MKSEHGYTDELLSVTLKSPPPGPPQGGKSEVRVKIVFFLLNDFGVRLNS